MHQWMNLLGHSETDEVVNALNSTVLSATERLATTVFVLLMN